MKYTFETNKDEVKSQLYSKAVRYQWYGTTTDGNFQRTDWGADTKQKALDMFSDHNHFARFDLVKETTTFEVVYSDDS